MSGMIGSNKMRSTDEPADHALISATAAFLGVSLTVYEPSDPTRKEKSIEAWLGQEKSPSVKRPVYEVAFLTDQFGTGGHYDSVVPSKY